MKNSIGKPYEGKLHVRFDEGGTDSLLILLSLLIILWRRLSGSTLPKHIKREKMPDTQTKELQIASTRDKAKICNTFVFCQH